MHESQHGSGKRSPPHHWWCYAYAYAMIKNKHLFPDLNIDRLTDELISWLKAHWLTGQRGTGGIRMMPHDRNAADVINKCKHLVLSRWGKEEYVRYEPTGSDLTNRERPANPWIAKLPAGE